MQIEEVVKIFELKPHPEGGYYKETYRSKDSVNHQGLPRRFSGNRLFSTAIYYMLPQGSKSHFHRIKSDEVWHFYLGDPLIIVEILPNGQVQETTLGRDVKHGQVLQYVVPAGNWFAAYPKTESQYSLVGCTVSPGFDFADFEMANRSRLQAEYPDAIEVIERLTDR